jgi:excisionase family DNA binding protein
MKTDETMIVTMTVSDLRAIVREEVTGAVKNQSKPKLTYTTAEAAGILNVPETWLATAARDGKIPSLKIGHYVRFRASDLETFVGEKKAS